MTDTPEKLKPCPFCGGKARIQMVPDDDDFGDFYVVRCRCGAQSKEHFARETCPQFFEGVRDSWNTRNLDAFKAQIRAEVLEEASGVLRSVADNIRIAGQSQVISDTYRRSANIISNRAASIRSMKEGEDNG